MMVVGYAAIYVWIADVGYAAIYVWIADRYLSATQPLPNKIHVMSSHGSDRHISMLPAPPPPQHTSVLSKLSGTLFSHQGRDT